MVLPNGGAHKGLPKTEGGSYKMRRILMVLTVAALMAAMMVAMTMPAFAGAHSGLQ